MASATARGPCLVSVGMGSASSAGYDPHSCSIARTRQSRTHSALRSIRLTTASSCSSSAWVAPPSGVSILATGGSGSPIAPGPAPAGRLGMGGGSSDGMGATAPFNRAGEEEREEGAVEEVEFEEACRDEGPRGGADADAASAAGVGPPPPLPSRTTKVVEVKRWTQGCPRRWQRAQLEPSPSRMHFTCADRSICVQGAAASRVSMHTLPLSIHPAASGPARGPPSMIQPPLPAHLAPPTGLAGRWLLPRGH